MSFSIENAFAKQYDAEVHEAYQQKASLLRGTVRSRMIVNAKDATFTKTGTGEAATKGRHAMVPTMEIPHTPVTVTPTDYFAAEYADDLDLLKTNIDERQVLTNAAAYALGRKTDDIIIAALAAASNDTALVTTSAATFRNSLITAVTQLKGRFVPQDGNLWGAISPQMSAWLLTVPEFANADWVGLDLPYRQGTDLMQGKRWLGVTWVEHNDLPLATATRTGFLYHKGAVVHGINKDVTSEIGWVIERDAWFIKSKMSMGAALLDDNGVEKITLVETDALPT
jgi:hypothetical protein